MYSQMGYGERHKGAVGTRSARMDYRRLQGIRKMRRFLTFFLFAFSALPQDLVINANKDIGPLKPIWKYFGYDEPNYTYAPNGKKLVGELAALGQGPVYIRTHFMLATGDGKASLKWGSTNAYIEDSQGHGHYD